MPQSKGAAEGPSVGVASRFLGQAGPAGAVVLLALAFAVIARWAEVTLRLPETAYRMPVVTVEILRELCTTLPGLVGLLPILAVAALRRRLLFCGWTDLEGAPGVRPLVLAMVLWATWAAVTLDHNLFYDQSYNADRLILILFAAFVFWRPVFVIPHVFLFIAIEHQFDHPFGRQIFARGILEDLLLLFAASLLTGAILRRRETRTFLFVACALLASYYWFPGWVKLTRGWVGYGQLYLGGFASYANGWLGSWPVDRVEGLLRLGAMVDWPARVLTLVSELAAVLFFVNRRIPRLLLGSWAILHVGAWVFSGVSFLVWIAVDLLFLALIFGRVERTPGVFSRGYALGGAALILASPLWVRPPPVGWFDTRLVYTYRYTASDDAGNRGALSPDITPLGEAWCARDFPFLLKTPSLLIRYGKTNDRALAEQVGELDGTPASLIALERQSGQVYFDPAQAAELDRFLASSAQHWNRRRSASHALSWAAPPRTCLSPRVEPEPVFDSGRPIRSIQVDHLTFVFDGRTFREIRRVPVRTIEVPA